MTEHITGNIYKIYVPLPKNPLRNLNAYLIKSERSLLIDTGFNRDECYESLYEGLCELNVDFDKLDIFITHLHSDHSGLAYRFQREGCRVYMSELDKNIILRDSLSKRWAYWDDYYAAEGFPLDFIDMLPENNVAQKYAPTGDCDFTVVSDGDLLHYGGYELRCVSAPGHTPRLMCLYIENEKIMFLSDHVLFDITPNIAPWQELEDSLGTYLESLDKFKAFDIAIPLPAHRGTGQSVPERIDEIKKHHEARLREAFDVVSSSPELTAYEAARRMTWDARGTWDDFPLFQKWFAVGETIAHLRYLEKRGRIIREMLDGMNRYRAISQFTKQN